LTPEFFIGFGESRWSKLLNFWQRGLSVVVASIGLVITAPLMAIMAILIKLDSSGPVFYIQSRSGLHGKPFSLVKFRTMNPVFPGREKSFWVSDNEERITRVGAWYRRLHLDELPQLLNILRGEMNLIGPRPHPTSNAALFRRQIPFYCQREVVRPGMTGWAQVRKGYANGLSEEIDKVRYDLYYIRNMSVRLDLRILAETVKDVLFGWKIR
jgi:lipopolysaccharide/colanic/teichoic acid biosynthesis glycosyltransferase